MHISVVVVLLFLGLFSLSSSLPVYETAPLEGRQKSDEADAAASRYSGHLVALRPDYTFWNMVNVIKSMFDGRAEKRVERALERVIERRRLDELLGGPRRRLVANIGRL